MGISPSGKSGFGKSGGIGGKPPALTAGEDQSFHVLRRLMQRFKWWQLDVPQILKELWPKGPRPFIDFWAMCVNRT